jgi:NitT/TauT family transport system substrate-binding protein
VEIERLDLPSSTTQTQALLAGDLHVNRYTVDSVARAVLAGAPLKFVASAQQTPNLQLIVAAGIESYADLRGKILGTGSPGGYFDVALKAMLQAHGLSPGEYELLAVRDINARIPALQTNQLAATLMSSPDDQIALTLGLKSLGFLAQTIPDLQFSGYAVSESWARANEATLVRFLSGTLRGLAWLRDPVNKEEAKRIFLQIAELPPESVETLYNQMVVEQMLGTDMRPSLSGTEKILTLAVQQGSLPSVPPLEAWMDLSYLDRASSAAR